MSKGKRKRVPMSLAEVKVRNARVGLSLKDKKGNLFRKMYSRFARYMKLVEEPWTTVNLSKASRKGKTPEQIQEMRKAVWKERQEVTG